MLMSWTPAVDLKSAKIAAVVNVASGRCSRATGAALRGQLARHGLEPAHLWCGLGADLPGVLDEVLADKPDVLIVLGGDGTIRTAAERCEPGGPLLMPLPGGTMNVLPRALYGGRTWRQALDAVAARPQVRPVTGAEVAVLCPLASARLDPGEARLEAAVIHPEGPIDAVRLVLSAAFRDWRADPDVHCAMAETIEVLGNGPFPGLLDGERFTFEGSLKVRLVPEAFLALTPG
ncbi:conserved hypothetical protein (plasmid) [Phenylobacterium zucineum HLK1]|uniref:DAGKc domain-containing protein n=2 Tax=Phenylobacterium zucineum TaxID=284016 RepID=B4RHZ9_PHEZH|nr:conserved hypothetical protein [Phenylobacterium zucineum HLK1]